MRLKRWKEAREAQKKVSPALRACLGPHAAVFGALRPRPQARNPRMINTARKEEPQNGLAK